MSKTDRFAHAGLRAAQWFANSQVQITPPYWDANFGRFIYNRHLPTGLTVLGLSWTQGRGLFTLMAAYELTGDKTLLRPMAQALEYLKVSQVYDWPDNPRRQFTFAENMPQDWFAHVRDASEAALSLLFLYRLTRDQDLLRRAVDFGKWFEASGFAKNGWPNFKVFLDRPRTIAQPASYTAGNISWLYYLAVATGQKQPLRRIKRMAEITLASFIRPDGGIGAITDEGFHASGGGIVYNDDGLMVGLMCAYQAFGDRKYLDAVQRYAQWVVDHIHPPLAQFAGLPCICNTMIQLSELTGEARWRDWAAAMLAKYVLPLQVDDPRDPMSHGAFRGEDEDTKWYGPEKPGVPGSDFITTRVTCYAALACFKLAGLVGPYYGATGWDRKARRMKLPPIALA